MITIGVEMKIAVRIMWAVGPGRPTHDQNPRNRM